MDSYKDIYYLCVSPPLRSSLSFFSVHGSPLTTLHCNLVSFTNNKHVDSGDVNDRKTLRHSLGCKSFEWYDNILTHFALLSLYPFLNVHRAVQRRCVNRVLTSSIARFVAHRPSPSAWQPFPRGLFSHLFVSLPPGISITSTPICLCRCGQTSTGRARFGRITMCHTDRARIPQAALYPTRLLRSLTPRLPIRNAATSSCLSTKHNNVDTVDKLVST